MAQVMKKRSLVNSGRSRRRKRSNGTKRMSAKQIKYFGTARQRAALRASGSRRRTRKRNYGTRAGRSWSRYGGGGRRKSSAPSHHPGRRIGNAGVYSNRKTKKYRKKYGTLISRKRPVKRRRRNVGQIFSIGLAGLAGGNPGTKRKRRYHKKRSQTTMARRRRSRRANAGHRTYRRRRRTRAVANHRRTYRRRRRNSGVSYRRRRSYNRGYSHSRRRRRNPGVGGAISSSTGLLKNALGVIGGAVATRYATQLALGGKNTGAIGYLGNAIAALVLGWAAKKFLKSPQLGTMVTLGGFTGLALRMLSDLTPIGQYVNLSLSGAGKTGDTGIGLITDTTYFVPTVFNNGSMTDAQIPNQVRQLVAAGSVKSAGMGAYRRRRMAA